VEAAAATRDEIVLSFEDSRRSLRAVRLRTELLKRRPPSEFVRDREGTWRLSLPWPQAVDRLEYLLELEARDGSTELVPDPGNPLRAPSPFGDKSVLELPGYRPPAWVDDDEAPAGTVRRLRLRSRRLRGNVRGLLWSPPGVGPRDPLPLLVVHDGPEYAEYSGLLRLLESCTAELELPPLRAALLAPPRPRDEHYSASAAYARALALDVIPALERAAPRPRPEGRETRVGMGASLGALAMLHAHRLHAATFAGLFLQSGSFFRLRSDRQESGLPRFRRIARFVGSVLRATDWPDPIPVALTCGAGEENLANNRAVREALARQGYPAELHEHPDAHNWTAWRDSFHPPLVSLLQRLWG
jgi:enterochelin esterase-like enzyme